MATPTTRIGSSHRIEGTLRASEAVSLFGHLVGEFLSEDLLVVEADAIVEGDIRAERVVVLGTVVGDIEATDLVEIGATGQVAGAVTTRSFELIAGGRISGRVESGATVRRPQLDGRRTTSARSAMVRRAPVLTPEKREKPRATAPKRKAKPKRSKAKVTRKRKPSSGSKSEVVELPAEVVELDVADAPSES